LDRRKAYKETIWDDLQGTTKVLKTSVWTATVRNYISQKTGEIEDFKALEVGTLKWCKDTYQGMVTTGQKKDKCTKRVPSPHPLQVTGF
jgi:hypothetical protein